MKSRKNTINGKVIVTGDVNELEPNEIMINEKLNEDGTVSLDIKDISNNVKVATTNNYDGLHMVFRCANTATIIYTYNTYYTYKNSMPEPGSIIDGDVGGYIKLIDDKTLEYHHSSGSFSISILKVNPHIDLIIDDKIYETSIGEYKQIQLDTNLPNSIILYDTKQNKPYITINKKQ